MPSRKPKTIAILGAGARGTGFAELISQHGQWGRVAAVAEPREPYRQAMVRNHGLGSNCVFDTWQEFVKRPRLCDAVIIATPDRDHAGPAVACLRKGYDLLLEKPMATALSECRAIERAQRQSGGMVGICHSLRYQKGFRKVKELIDAGAIGRVVTIDQLEQVAYWHQAHSYVRGNWGNEGRASFMLLAKSCHDIDYVAWLAGSACRRVSSYGSLAHFRRENAPEGSPARCTDGCPAESGCPYSALRWYVNGRRDVWPAAVISPGHSREEHLEAVRSGPYGRCVYRCDNDVVDHQVVAMEFAGGVTATFTMTAFTQGGGRRLRVHGDRGELAFDERTITIRTFGDDNVTEIALGPEPGGHGGGDVRVVRDWLRALHTRDRSLVVADAQESLRTHTIVFAAERSRREGRAVSLADLK